MLLLAAFACLVCAQAIGLISLRQHRAEGVAAAVVFVMAAGGIAIALRLLGLTL